MELRKVIDTGKMNLLNNGGYNLSLIVTMISFYVLLHEGKVKGELHWK